MKNKPIAIIGGGIAGLSLAIVLAKKGHEVIVFEKHTYPNHKVCGEYVSRETENFLDELGVLSKMDAYPRINRLQVSSPKGKVFETAMHVGGIGISRYAFDNLLYLRAKELGVSFVFEEVVGMNEVAGEFIIETKNNHQKAKRVVGAFGKRSNLDVQWQRPFTLKAKNRLNQWIGIKHHVYLDEMDAQTIALHNFEGGYCGISRVEDNKVCLCYLVNSKMLKNLKISQLETDVLSKNPFLKHIFKNATKLFDKPLAISQISFDAKEQVVKNVPMIGDAAGLIKPLCGNGMSLALQTASIFAQSFDEKDHLNRYKKEWNKQIANRLVWGRMIQKGFGNPAVSEILVGAAKAFPKVGAFLVGKTHGEAF